MNSENEKQFKLKLPNVQLVSYQDKKNRFKANVQTSDGNSLAELVDGSEPLDVSHANDTNSGLLISFMDQTGSNSPFKFSEMEFLPTTSKSGERKVKLHFEVGDPDTVVLTIIIDEGPGTGGGNK